MPTLIEKSKISEKIVIPLGITDPAFADKITKNGNPVDLSKATEIMFFMRPVLSRKPVIDGAEAKPINPPDEEGNNVKYEWEETDVAIEGEYMVWWGFTIENKTFETSEFPITISDHGPGLGVKTGAIVDGVAEHMPITFSALRKDSSFGDRRLQKYAVLIQARILGSAVEPDAEISTYELPLLDYFSKRLAFELCTPGIDFWARQPHTINAVSPSEMVSFPNMIEALEKLRERLREELVRDWRDLRFLIPALPQRKATPLPSSSLDYCDNYGPNNELVRTNERADFITANPRFTMPLTTGFWGALDPSYHGIFPFP